MLQQGLNLSSEVTQPYRHWIVALAYFRFATPLAILLRRPSCLPIHIQNFILEEAASIVFIVTLRAPAPLRGPLSWGVLILAKFVEIARVQLPLVQISV